MKVFEFAKQYGVSNKDVLAFLSFAGIDVKSHLSKLDDAALTLVMKKFAGGVQPLPPAEKKEEAPKKERKKAVKSETEQAEKKPKRVAKVKEEPQVVALPEEKKPLVKEAVSKPVSVPPPVQPVIPPRVVPPPVQTARPVQPVRPSVIVPKAPAMQEPVRKPDAKRPEQIMIKIPITVGALATNLTMRTSDMIKALMEIGIFASVNQLLDEAIINKVSEKLNVVIEKLPSEEEKLLQSHDKSDDPATLKLRPPVVTMMGHVDHGKTSLLDAIRKTNVADREAGRITQHIGAYEVSLPGKGAVTFLDTPGHAAFTAMRSRGANLTDIVILVVAGDDGVMPQTIEAIDHARAAEIPIVVAINKCDLPSANIDKVKGALQKIDLVAEDWGGKTIMLPVSAKTGKGIDELLEMLLLQAEIMELKANPDRPAQGTVIEGMLSKSLGSIANVLIQNGTLRIGDVVVCGRFYGKVRAMHNDKGKNVKESGPSMPVEILGLNGVPDAGERFYVVQDEKQARTITEKRLLEMKEKSLAGGVRHLSLEGLFDKMKEDEIKELKIVLKADVQGSSEVLKSSLEKLSTDKIKLKVIHAGVGGLNESDVVLAAASDAIIIGFHVKADSKAQQLIEKEKVDVKYYKIIYDAINEVKLAMEGLLEPTVREVILGHAEITQLFKASKVGNIAGCMVRKGKLVRNQMLRLIRDNVVVYEGKLDSLRRFKDDAKEVAEGYECGVVLSNFNDIKPGDIIECYKEEKIATKL